MCKYVFFDTETTSLLHARKGVKGREVIQFAAIVTDTDFNILRVINRYCNSAQMIVPGAEAVHKLSNKKIEILSGGKFFETVVEEEGLRDFRDVTWVAFNCKFDTQTVNQTLVQNGYPGLDFGSSIAYLPVGESGVFNFDAMSPLSRIHKSNRRVSLSTLIKAHMGESTFRFLCCRYREQFNIQDPKIGEDDYFHNAIFDTIGLMHLVYKYRNLLLK